MLPQSLEDRLRSGDVIPFVGAGVSRAVLGRDGSPLFPGWGELLLHAAEQLEKEGKVPESQVVRGLLKIQKPDYLDAARRARDGLGPLWTQLLQQEIDRRFEDADPESLALARAIWQLGSLVVTTNYDKVLQWACPDPLARDLDFWDIQAKIEQHQLLRSGRPARPTVWHLHGRIGNAAELILTPDGYERLYGDGMEGIYNAALRTFQTLAAARSLLFVGFSFDDHALGVQLKAMNELFAGAPGPHYALVHAQDAERLRRLDLPVELIPFSDFGDPLVDLIREMSEIAKQGSTSPPLPRPPPAGASYSTDNRPFFVPFRPKGDRVIGAEQALRRVRDQLTQGRPTSIGQTAAFEGLGGLGKTQLAVEYAWRYSSDYPNGVIWLTADQDISAQLTRLAVEARWVAAESEHKVKLDIAQHRVRSYSDCLVIFDNVESLAAIEPYLPHPSAQPHLLGTSRTEQPGFVPVPLDILDEDQSLALLASEADRSPAGDEEEEAAREIARELGGLPLALEMAGAYLLNRPIRWQQYRDMLRKDAKAAFRSRLLASFTRHEADLFATLRIQEGLFEAEPRLREILDVLTWSGSAAMGLSLLAALLNTEATDLLGALSLGVKLRLIESSSKLDRYSLHRLVRKVRQEDHPLAEVSVWAEEVCRRLGDWFFARRRDFADLAIFEAEIDHLQRWREQAVSRGNSQASRLTWLLAYPPFHRGQYAESHRWLDQALDLFQREDNPDQELNAWLWHDLGSILSRQGRRREALELDKRTLDLRRKVLGEEHPDTAFSFFNIGMSYLQLNDLEMGLDLSTRALDIRRKVLGGEHPDTAASLESMGRIYRELGDVDKALAFATEALVIKRKILGEEHPQTARSLAYIANDYQAQGYLDRALDFYMQAYVIQHRTLGDNHPDTADVLGMLDVLHFERGNLELSLEFSLRALHIWRKIGGTTNSETITATLNTAITLRNMERRQEAFDLISPYVQDPPSDPEQASKIKSLVQQLKAKPFRPGFRVPPAHGKERPNKKKRH
jgi:tetratricopeptide (TPR) repeat protein